MSDKFLNIDKEKYGKLHQFLFPSGNIGTDSVFITKKDLGIYENPNSVEVKDGKFTLPDIDLSNQIDTKNKEVEKGTKKEVKEMKKDAKKNVKKDKANNIKKKINEEKLRELRKIQEKTRIDSKFSEDDQIRLKKIIYGNS